MAALKRFKQLLDSYGADPARWPDKDRRRMQALLEGSAEARRLHEEARQFDRTLGEARLQSDSHLWHRDDPGGAVARLRAGVSAGIAQRASHQKTPRPVAHGLRGTRWLAPWFDVRNAGPAAALRSGGLVWGSAAAILVGLWIGWAQATPMAPPDLLTMLQSALINEVL